MLNVIITPTKGGGGGVRVFIMSYNEDSSFFVIIYNMSYILLVQITHI